MSPMFGPLLVSQTLLFVGFAPPLFGALPQPFLGENVQKTLVSGPYSLILRVESPCLDLFSALDLFFHVHHHVGLSEN